MAMSALLAVARADAAVVISIAGDHLPTVTVAGGPLYYANADTAAHNVVAIQRRPDRSAPFCDDYPDGKCPLFWTPIIGPGTVVEVQGMADVAPGTYRYICEIHPSPAGRVIVF